MTLETFIFGICVGAGLFYILAIWNRHFAVWLVKKRKDGLKEDTKRFSKYANVHIDQVKELKQKLELLKVE